MLLFIFVSCVSFQRNSMEYKNYTLMVINRRRTIMTVNTLLVKGLICKHLFPLLNTCKYTQNKRNRWEPKFNNLIKPYAEIKETERYRYIQTQNDSIAVRLKDWVESAKCHSEQGPSSKAVCFLYYSSHPHPPLVNVALCSGPRPSCLKNSTVKRSAIQLYRCASVYIPKYQIPPDSKSSCTNLMVVSL